jgi:biopolymer transport protein ExbB/TolQ
VGQWWISRAVARVAGFLLLAPRLIKKGELKLQDQPTYKIARVGMGAVLVKGEDVREVLESRTGAEIEDVRKKSFIDLLWGMGVISPLLGLFGTVTGLSFAFFSIVSASPDSSTLLQELSSGIFESLFTTIWGLTAGVLAMLVYYYYNYKLDRLYAVWQMFASAIIDQYTYKFNSVDPAAGGGEGDTTRA